MDSQFNLRLLNLYDTAIKMAGTEHSNKAIGELLSLCRDYRIALEKICYPGQWPAPSKTVDQEGFDFTDEVIALRKWMSATASNALTNGGKQ